jgi:hypothetical protein
MWRHFRIWAESVSKQGNADAIVAAAVATFQTLQDWLIPAN